MVSVEDLVFTSREDPGSVDLAVALAAEHWPETDPDDAWRRNVTRFTGRNGDRRSC